MDKLERSVQQSETDIFYIVKGSEGAVTLNLIRPSHTWNAVALHHKVPPFEFSHALEYDCEYLEPAQPCFGDCSFTAGRKIGEKFDHDGDLEALWVELEDWYRERIDKEG